MKGAVRKRFVSSGSRLGCVVVAACLLGACGTSAPGVADVPDPDVPRDAVEPLAWPPPELAGGLPFPLQRPDEGPPVPPAEVTELSSRLGTFLRDVGYFDYVLRATHGVDASTGMRGYALWWSEVDPVRQGDVVYYRHRPLDEHGGHNILVPNAGLLGAAIAGDLLGQDPAATLLAGRLCDGITALMLGMAFDADDPLDHLMARNIVTFNHEYVTHDGRRKAVDYTPWHHPYDRWNCSRFLVPDNPHWGPVWVTNVRSKDDVGHLFRVVPWIRFAARWSRDDTVRQACGQTDAYLTRFARDIVDSGYFIRTRDAEGDVLVFSQADHPPGMRRSTDLDNFVDFEGLWPGTECNAMRCADLIAFGDGARTACPSGAPNDLERFSLRNNYPNINFFRAFHASAVFLSLALGEHLGADALLHGLVERLEGDRTMDRDGIAAAPDRWDADLALGLLTGAVVGVPLTAVEARLVATYYGRALDAYARWTAWDPWDPAVPDEALAYAPDRGSTGDDGTARYWIPIEALATPLEYCASPFRNPSGIAPFDCDALLAGARMP